MTTTTDAAFPCVQCGSAVPRSALFCLVCGTPVSSRSQSAALGPVAGAPIETDRDGAPIDGWRPTPAAPPIRPGDVLPSGYGRRVAAFLLDSVAGTAVWLLITMPLIALGVIGVTTTGDTISVAGGSAVLLLLPALLVPLANLLLQSFVGFSLGMRILGLRIVNVQTLGKPGLGWMLLRNLVVAAATLVLLIGQWVVYLSPLWDPEKRGRGWHDKIARTWVIDVKAGPNPLTARPGQLLLDEVRSDAPEAPGWPGGRAAYAAPVAHAAARPSSYDDAPPAAPAPLPAPAPSPLPTAAEPISIVPGFAPELPVGEPDDFDSTRLSDSGRTPIDAGVTSFVLDSGERVPITRHGVLGRDPVSPGGDASDTLIALSGDTLSVSKTHLEFGVDGGAVWVSDRGSTNGTAIVRADGEEYVLDPGEKLTVVAGDRVRVGTRLFAVEVSGGNSGGASGGVSGGGRA